MNTLTKILTSLALAAGVFPGAAFGVSVADYTAETAVAAGLEIGTLLASFYIGMSSYGWDAGPSDPGGLAVSYVFFGAYPFACAGGAVLTGERVDGASSNPGATFAYTLVAAYGQSVLLVGTGAAIESSGPYDIDDVFFWYGFVDVVTKPFLTAWVYNLVKRPVGAGESRAPNLEPYVAVARGGNGRPVPLYGLTFSF